MLRCLVLEIILKIKSGKVNSVIGIIKKKKKSLKFTHIIELKSDLVLVKYPHNFQRTATSESKLKKQYQRIDDIVEVHINPSNIVRRYVKHNNCHFVFDVDSTLTTGRGTIQSKILNIFNRMQGDGHRIYLASGRSAPQLREDIEKLDIEKYGIAENGGILLGFGEENELVVGDRQEPDKVSEYIKKKCKKVKEDIRQGMRKTERIFKNTIPEKKFMEYVKKSKAQVNVLASKNTYHVTKKGIDKGSALEKLRNRLRLGDNDIVIGVGDSNLDIPLLQEADYGFVVGNATEKLKKEGIVLKKNYADGVEEMYEKLFR